MSQDDDLNRQHRNWMDVTATALHPVHSASGYKGPARKPLIRPQLPPEEPKATSAGKS
ncbi:hypothetical protein [Marinobacterium aestuariivivens]|uniref:Uncharacterized protein n=1 Tax=Marinobacterium aestuariivivens TaxID=1698799 RepID=A0ABW2A8S5_9GAMM